jgi:hypothetical protein
LALPSHALAGTYEVEVCTPTANAGSQFEPPFVTNQGLVAGFLCNAPFGGIGMRAVGGTVMGFETWRLVAPPNTRITSLDTDLAFDGSWEDNRLRWNLRTVNPSSTLESASAAFVPGDHHANFDFNAEAVFSTLSCDATGVNPVCVGFNGVTLAEITMKDIGATLEDTSFPTASIVNPPSPSTPLRGSVSIPYTAHDLGAGVSIAELTLGSTIVGSDHDSNNDRCKQPFAFLVPCKLNIQPGPGEGSISLDTTKLPEGTNTLALIVGDAASNFSFEPGVQITVHNAPTNTARPVLSGAAKVGERLSTTDGQWDGASISFTYQWLRCPPQVADKSEAGCTAISGATAANYTATAEDAGKRLLAKVIATNGKGSETALSAPSAPVAKSEKEKQEEEKHQEEREGANAPQTKLAKHPRKKTARRTARFTFSSDQPGSSFQCKLDKGPFKSCRSPFKRKVKRQRHLFQVRAVNSAGTADPTPAKFSWRVG